MTIADTYSRLLLVAVIRDRNTGCRCQGPWEIRSKDACTWMLYTYIGMCTDCGKGEGYEVTEREK